MQLQQQPTGASPRSGSGPATHGYRVLTDWPASFHHDNRLYFGYPSTGVHRSIISIVAVQYVAALGIELVTGFRYRPEFIIYFSAALIVSLFGCVCAAMSRYALAGLRGKNSRLPGVSSDIPFIYFMVAAQLSVLSWLKAAMPYSVGFRYDEILADLDALMFRADPWRLLQWLPEGPIDAIYITWPSATLLLMMILPMLPKGSQRDRALVCYFLVVASASLGQYLLPSAGPIFYERIGLGQRFADLPIQPWVQVTADYLWGNYQSQGAQVGVGISAFPSLHVAGAAWIALTVSSYARRLSIVAWSYFAIILVGSVSLGWHYAADGIAGVILALGAWKLVSWPAERWSLPRLADLPN